MTKWITSIFVNIYYIQYYWRWRNYHVNLIEELKKKNEKNTKIADEHYCDGEWEIHEWYLLYFESLVIWSVNKKDWKINSEQC